MPGPPSSPLFPYTTLFRSAAREPQPVEGLRRRHLVHEVQVDVEQVRLAGRTADDVLVPHLLRQGLADRKSTRLNSSHMSNSYAVFCLKKKNKADLPDYAEI